MSLKLQAIINPRFYTRGAVPRPWLWTEAAYSYSLILRPHPKLL